MFLISIDLPAVNFFTLGLEIFLPRSKLCFATGVDLFIFSAKNQKIKNAPSVIYPPTKIFGGWVYSLSLSRIDTLLVFMVLQNCCLSILLWLYHRIKIKCRKIATSSYLFTLYHISHFWLVPSENHWTFCLFSSIIINEIKKIDKCKTLFSNGASDSV